MISVVSTSETSSKISELFEKDPRLVTDEELDLIVARFREKRELFVKEEKEAKVKGRRTDMKQGVKSLDELDIDMSKIGGDNEEKI